MDTGLLLLTTAAKIGFILAITVGLFAPVLVWAERRQSAMIQDRVGPHRAGIKLPPVAVPIANGLMWLLLAVAGAALLGLLVQVIRILAWEEGAVTPTFWWLILTIAAAAMVAGVLRLIVKSKGNITLLGLLHPLADAIKFIWKEDFVPPKADKLLHGLAPIVVLVPAIATFAVVPFADTLYLEYAFDVIPRDGAIGGATPVPMQIASLNIGILFIFALAGTGIIGAAIGGYASDNKYSLLGGMRAAGQMVSYEVALGLTLVGCFMVYGTLRLEEMVLWQANHYWGFIAQPLGFILYSTAAIAETKRIPFDVPEGESELVGGYFTEYSGMKFGMFFMGEFIEVVLLAALATTIFFGGWDVPFLYRSGFQIDFLGWHTEMPHFAVIGIQVLAFLFKVTALIWLQLQVRWTLPRFRYDQIMSLCWKYLLPLALVNILVTGVLVLLFPGLFGG